MPELILRRLVATGRSGLAKAVALTMSQTVLIRADTVVISDGL
jgi:hypothetical protein